MGGGFQDAGAQPLTAHFHQAERRNTADLDAGAIVAQRVLHRLFDAAVVGADFHVDEIDDHQPGHVAQAQLPADFIGGFQVGLGGGFLDAIFARRTPRVDVDRHQGLGGVDDDIATRFELDDRLVHALQLRFDAETLKQRHIVGIFDDLGGMPRHQHRHEARGIGKAFGAFDEHLIDVAMINVADGALDQVRILVDQRRRRTGQRLFADFVPQPRQIIEIAANIFGTALQAGGPHDGAHALWQPQIAHDRLQALPVGDIGNLAADAAAMRGVGHQHAITPGQAEIGGQRRALAAALFLDDLDQQHLAAVDDFLNLVAATQRLAFAAQCVGWLVVLAAGFGDVVAFRLAIFIKLVIVMIVVIRSELGFLAEQGFAVFTRDLVIIGVDFAERQETVAIAAIFDKSRLQ